MPHGIALRSFQIKKSKTARTVETGDRPLPPADTGYCHDEERLSRRQRGKRPAAGVRDTRPHSALHRSFRPLFPPGITF